MEKRNVDNVVTSKEKPREITTKEDRDNFVAIFGDRWIPINQCEEMRKKEWKRERRDRIY